MNNSETLSYEQLLNLYSNQQHIINNQQKMLNKFNDPNKSKKTINPYDILGISKNYDLRSLKKAYIQKAMITHPDRGGNPIEFKNVLISYKVLLKLYENKTSNSDHNILKTTQGSFNEQQTSNNFKNVSLDKKFNSSTFNKIFDETKTEDIYDDGYEKWYKSSDDTKPIFNSKVGISTFNTEFEKQKYNNLKKSKNELMIQEPIENISLKSADSLMILGQKKISNFGGSSNGLHFYDLKKAYDNNYINDTVEPVQERTINSVENERSDISYTMSNSELKNYQKNKIREDKNETRRLKRLDHQDVMASKLYEQIHGRLISNT